MFEGLILVRMKSLS